ncbi:hypothetical protein PHYSODRAFT_373785, partial [Phytophthora sojae]
SQKSKKSKKVASKRYWDADAEDLDSPTSLDVLFQWLSIPGNYHRWQTAGKQSVCNEIVAHLKGQGIMHRGAKNVWMKMDKLENTFETATNWLLANGHYADFQRGSVAGDVRRQLEKLCRYYDELAPVFQRGVPASTAPSEGSSDTTLSDAGHDPGMDSARMVQSQSPHIRYSRRLQEFELECKKAQLQADVACNTALNRKKMLDAGIDIKEVDRVLP